ncbi:MAG: bifunctional 5,10-methylenetetrahydrofolate dehydrogenase/5,10-methenyltetrahydrofolate cyclohydrolase [Candidatus Micrarchaeota archaeon]|nr:bifunctional 5,10-methylenetetrahydrofolate dehydrogenase/5,10-methenyltetrahydrofolate cyclohydrolase [Candidatus Micrarchaeota archaeon]
MVAKILDGKKLANKILKNLKKEIELLGAKPKLVIIQIGKNEASEVYIKRKINASKKIGIICEVLNFEQSVSQSLLEEKIQQLNSDSTVNGIIIQLPVPEHLDILKLQAMIDPKKDVDGFGPINLGNMFLGRNLLLPATPAGVLKLLEEYKLELEGKIALVIGRSNIVGKPLSILLLQKNATVILAHSKTKDLDKLCKLADFVFVAVGKPNFLSGSKIKKGAVVIDIGINKIKVGNAEKIVGDVDFQSAFRVAYYISPVPGGVGPLTVASLLENTLLAYKIQKGLISR